MLVATLVGAAVASYLFVMYQELAQRPGNPTTMDFAVACVGIPLAWGISITLQKTAVLFR